jgi:hypothetical protein
MELSMSFVLEINKHPRLDEPNGAIKGLGWLPALQRYALLL